MSSDPYRVVKRLVVTEKNVDLQAFNKYVFEVDKKANKIEIKKAISALFDVSVLAVNTIKKKPEQRRTGSRAIRKKETKKAIVTVAEGQSIDLLD